MRFAIFLLTAAGLFAQQPNSVSANVSVVQPVTTANNIFRIQFVDATQTATVETAVTALSSVGVSASQLTGVDVAISQGFVLTTFTFRLVVPTAEFAATRDKIVAVQRTLATSQTQGLGWSSSQNPSAEELTTALQQALPGLLSLARQRAALLAQAMNATLGTLQALSSPSIVAEGPSVTISLAANYSVTATPPQ
jgi:hypothetical protein